MLPRIRKTLLALTCVGALLGGCGQPEPAPEDVPHLIRSGMSSLQIMDFDTAQADLATALELMSPNDPKWGEVTFALAVAKWNNTPYSATEEQEARELMQNLLDSDVSSKIKNAARIAIGRMDEVAGEPGESTDVPAARELYRQVIADQPTGEAGYQASLRLAQTYVQELTPESVQKALEIIHAQIKRDPESPWASVAWQYAGDLQDEFLDNEELALEYYQKAEKMGFANNSRTDVYLWVMSQWALDLGKIDEAMRLWRRIVDDFPRSTFRTLARDLLEEHEDQNGSLSLNEQATSAKTSR